MRALVLEEMAQGNTIPSLIWHSLTGFSDLLTVTLKKGPESELEKRGS